jgi:hypothetical protein
MTAKNLPYREILHASGEGCPFAVICLLSAATTICVLFANTTIEVAVADVAALRIIIRANGIVAQVGLI